MVDIRLSIFEELLAPMRPGRLLDLGAGHGKFAAIASCLGWEVTAVDARTDRWSDLSGVEWIQSDVRDFDTSGFDVICVLGLLYHLELDAVLALLAKCAYTTTILDTHVTLEATHAESGVDGYMFFERVEETTAAWGNEYSFWPTRESLGVLLSDAGYSSVFEYSPWYEPTRTFYLCLPPYHAPSEDPSAASTAARSD